MAKKIPTTKKIFARKYLLLALGVVVVVLAGLIASGLRSSSKTTVNPSPSTQPTNSTSPSPSGTSKSPSNGSVSTQGTPTPVPTSASAAFPAPTGQILNKGEVKLSVTNDADQYGSGMDSTCETVAGATCGFEIISANGTIKTLPAKVASANNGIYGIDTQWNVKTLGLSVGTWKVHAVATKNGQTVKSADWQLKVTE